VKRAHARMLLEEQRAAIRTVSSITERSNCREVLGSFITGKWITIRYESDARRLLSILFTPVK
jgi:hypothetical protein